MSLPTLYKKNSSGSLQFWTISVYEDSDHSQAYIIQTEYGQLGTDSPQVTFDTIWEGKNLGKANETTTDQQADFEAFAKWEKQKKKGYVQSVEEARAGKVDKLIEGGVLPMLAHKFSEQGHKIKYGCYVQPKLDGIRCIAILKDRKCTLWSRTRKPVTSLPHIVAEIERMFVDDIILDGEAYSHKFKSDFEKIVSAVRKEKAEEGHLNVEYHIYDTINDEPFSKRTQKLHNCFTIGNPKFEYLKQVPTEYIEKEEDVVEAFSKYRAEGYEGAMLRNADGLYVNKRSYDLQKCKEMMDDDFSIKDISEGKGKLSGHVGSFICVTKDGKEFNAKMEGSLERLKEYFEDPSLWEGKELTVSFQRYSNYGIPIFPVGKTIRDYE